MVEYFSFKKGVLEFNLKEYKPQKLEETNIESFPLEYHCKDVPWISYRKGYCESASLQMIAYKHGVKASVEYLNFLMGLTYGHFYCQGSKVSFQMTDPDIGYEVAASYLGLERKYLITNKEKLFSKAMRFFLSRGYPIRIALNASKVTKKLANENRFLPHSIVLVGYDESGFYYYETTQNNKYEEGKKGLKVTDKDIIYAVRDLCEMFSYPWEFAFTIFENHRKREKDIYKILKRNGELLLCHRHSFPNRFISEIMKCKPDDLKPIKWKLHFASYSRIDNSSFLKQYFAGDGQLEKAASLFKKAGECYEQGESLIKKNVENKVDILTLLNKAVSNEREAGEIFMMKALKYPDKIKNFCLQI